LDGRRYLVVTADDFGIGPATSQGILDLAARGLLTGTVLLVTSPHAEAAVRTWRQAGAPLELGWHPCLTLDRPVLPPGRVPSLVGPDGRFWPLGGLVGRLCRGLARPAEIEAELRAQYRRFLDLVGRPPPSVNSHHHVQVFRPVGALLRRVLAEQRPPPYVRRVREPWPMLGVVPGARCKRALLTLLGRREARRCRRAGLPGNDWLAGVTDPPCVADPDYLVRWLTRIPGRAVELTCHPGYLDTTLIGRDCTATDGLLLRRVRELHLLRQPGFRDACRRAGFTLVPASAVTRLQERGRPHAA
jgi:chitin disaccharide deacetylase